MAESVGVDEKRSGDPGSAGRRILAWLGSRDERVVFAKVTGRVVFTDRGRRGRFASIEPAERSNERH